MRKLWMACLPILITTMSYSQLTTTEILGRLDVRHTVDFTSIYIGNGTASEINLDPNVNDPRQWNVFCGYLSGQNNTTGGSNSFFGSYAGSSTTTGFRNSFFGRDAGIVNRTGSSNSFFGSFTGARNSTGSFNSFFGVQAGEHINKSRNIAIGNSAGPTTAVAAANDRLYIDVKATNDPLIYGEFDGRLVRVNGSFEATGQIKASTALLFTADGSNDNGLIQSDRSELSSDLVLDSNHDIVLELDSNDDENGEFRVLDGDDVVIFRLFETGSLNIGGTLFQGSDINRKHNIEPINPEQVLTRVIDLPLYNWQYKGETTPHLGPMAQDFYAAFGLGQGETTIATVDADGVALAAIQALARENNELQKRSERLEKLNKELELRLVRLEQKIFEK